MVSHGQVFPAKPKCSIKLKLEKYGEMNPFNSREFTLNTSMLPKISHRIKV